MLIPGIWRENIRLFPAFSSKKPEKGRKHCFLPFFSFV
jgi:hypothetical protein